MELTCTKAQFYTVCNVWQGHVAHSLTTRDFETPDMDLPRTGVRGRRIMDRGTPEFPDYSCRWVCQNGGVFTGQGQWRIGA